MLIKDNVDGMLIKVEKGIYFEFLKHISIIFRNCYIIGYLRNQRVTVQKKMIAKNIGKSRTL